MLIESECHYFVSFVKDTEKSLLFVPTNALLVQTNKNGRYVYKNKKVLLHSGAQEN
jgi:hypothetical protein